MKRLWEPICERLAIEIPIFGFAYDIDAGSAISGCGGFGVYGATFRFPGEIKKEPAMIRSKVGEKVFGVDLGLPPGMPDFNSRDEIEAEIPDTHKRFVEGLKKNVMFLTLLSPV